MIHNQQKKKDEIKIKTIFFIFKITKHWLLIYSSFSEKVGSIIH